MSEININNTYLKYTAKMFIPTFISLCAISMAQSRQLRIQVDAQVSSTDEWPFFLDFQTRFSKRYDSLDELIARFSNFRDQFNAIRVHNSDPYKNFTLGINQFSDLTPAEFKSLYVSGIIPDTELGASKVGSYGCGTFSKHTSGLPASVDWRTMGGVTSVKDQGQCGSCWTFSSTGAIEGAWAIAHGSLVDLSEQQLVDCATGIQYGSHGCNGGQMDGGFKYVISNGQCALSAYPYTAKDGTCKTCNSVAKISSCYDVTPKDQLALKSAVFQQPVSVAIEADTRYFQSYSGGILDSADCGTTLDHGVLVVGYGEEAGKKYWLVKNSWSSTWGENGYIKIARSESTNDAGICGIALDPSFPVV